MRFLHYILLVGISCKDLQRKQQQFLNDGDYEDDDGDGTFSIFFLFILGFFLLIFSVALLWYNERRNAINEYRLAKARDACKIGDCHNVDQSLNGQLVYLFGQTTTDQVIEDNEFGLILSQCIQLKRYVEQLQFVQIEHKRKHAPTTYTYELKWKKEPICSAGFPHEYQNKPELWVVKSQESVNPDVKLGSFTLTESLKKATKKFEDIVPEDAQIQAASKLFDKQFSNIHVKDKDIYFSQSSGNNRQVGDLRICFQAVYCGNATVVSQQFNDTFVPFQILDKYKSEKSYHEDEDDEDEGCCGGCCEQVAQIAKSAEEPIKEIDWIREKKWSKNKVFMMELSSNAATTYRTRFLGFVLMVIGFVFIFYPVIWLFSLLPLIGQFAAAFLLFIFLGISIIISLPICFLIALIAWMRYHPLYSVINFIGLGLTIYLVYVFVGVKY